MKTERIGYHDTFKKVVSFMASKLTSGILIDITCDLNNIIGREYHKKAVEEINQIINEELRRRK